MSPPRKSTPSRLLFLLMAFLGLMTGSTSCLRVSALVRNCAKSEWSRTCPSVFGRYQGQRISNPRRCLSQKDDSEPTTSSLTLEISTAEDTEEVGALFSAMVLQSPQTQKGSTIFLDGDLGAGKTAFARGFLRAATGDEELRVTSPTYLLVNVYPIGDLEVHHMDLYRLSGDPDDFLPLNLPHVFKNCVSLIEWPQRLGKVPIPDNRLDINIRIQPESDGSAGDKQDGEDDKPRIMTIQPRGAMWEQMLQSIQEEGFLDDLLL